MKRSDSLQSRRKVSAVSERSDTTDQGSGGEDELQEITPDSPNVSIRYITTLASLF